MTAYFHLVTSLPGPWLAAAGAADAPAARPDAPAGSAGTLYAGRAAG